jgi:hypothetical protein
MSSEQAILARSVPAGGTMQPRPVRKIVKSHATMEGAGGRLHRAIGLGPPEEYDPFLLLDDFRSDTPADYQAGFPWHPHRGMETITYVLRGQVEHQDSLGNRGVISPGDLQWMSAGSGVIHQEMPKGDDRGAMYGFQLWANLPAASKMSEPPLPRHRERRHPRGEGRERLDDQGHRRDRQRRHRSRARCRHEPRISGRIRGARRDLQA